MNREFPWTAVRILAGKKTFLSKVNATNIYKLPDCCFFDFYFMRAHLRFCCLVSGGRAKLFTCEKVVSPARVILPAEARQRTSPSKRFKQMSGKISRQG